MTDLANLGIQFQSDSVEVTNKRLDDFVGKSGAAQKATDALAAGQGRATSALMQQLAAIERLLSDLLKVTQAQTQAAGATNTFSRAQTEAAAAAQKAAQAQRQAADAALAQTKALEQSAQASRAASAAWTAQAQATAISAAAQAKHITTSAQMAAAFEAVTLAGGANLVSMQALYGAAGRTEKSLHGLGGAVGLNTMQLQELGHVVRSSAGTIMAGGDAFQALGFEASRLASILTIGPNGVGGTITALIGLFVRFLPIIGAVALAVGAAIAAFTLFRKATEDAVAQEKQFLAAQAEVANAMADTARYAHDAVAPINQMADAHDRAAAAARRQAMEELRLAEGQAQTALDKAKKDAESVRNRSAAQIGAAAGMAGGAGFGELGAITGAATVMGSVKPDQTDAVKLAQFNLDRIQRRITDTLGRPSAAFTNLHDAISDLDTYGTKIVDLQKKIADLKAGIADPSILRAQGLTVGQAQTAISAGEKQIAELRKREAGRTPRAHQPPRDTTDERFAQLDSGVAQAAAEELQARLALTKEAQARGEIEKQIAKVQMAIRDSQINRQIADIADDKGLSKAKKDQLTQELQGVKALNGITLGLQNQATDQNTREALAREALDRDQSARENQIDLLQVQAGLAKSSYGRWQIEQKIAKAQRDLERAALQQVTIANGNTETEMQIAQARLAYLDQVEKLTAAKKTDDLFAAYSSAQDALDGLASAVKSHDWAGAWSSLAAAIETLKTAFSRAGTAQGRIGAVAGIAQAAGNIIGGGVGNVLGSAASGAMLGMQLGGPIGAGIGAIVGGISGILGNSAKKRQAEEAQRQAEAQRQQQIADQHRGLEIRLLQAEGNSLGALNAQRNDELAGLDATNRALAQQIYAAEDAAALEAKRRELTIRLDDLTGKSAEALAMTRQDELKALQPELRDLQVMIYARQDEADAMQKAADLAQKRAGLESEYYAAVGNATKATAIQREAELAAIEDSLKPMQQAVYAAEDWAAAIQKVNDAVSNAVSQVDAQISAAQSQASAARQSAQAYRDAASSLQDAARQVRGGVQSPAQNVASQRGFLDRTFGRALSGDTGALGQLGGLGTTFLDTFRGQASSALDVRRETARVATMFDQASNAAGIDAGVMDYQATLLDAQVGILKDIRDNLSGPDPNLDLLKQQTGLLDGIGKLLRDQTGNLITINSTLTDQTGQIITGNAIVSSQTGQIVAITAVSGQTVQEAVQQQTGQVVTGNSILAAQNGQLQAQTGAVNAGLSTQDAIRNITATGAGYTAEMVQALINSANSQGGSFGTMLAGLNNVVAVLADIRGLLGGQQSAPPPLPTAPSTPTVSAFDRAKLALLSGDQAAAEAYIRANTDVSFRYYHPTGNQGDINPLGGESLVAFALRHFRLAGQFEAFSDHGRNLFAMGGAFANGIVTRPTAFSMGQMGEAGPEGILPLANINGRLGVYAANDNGSGAEISQLRSEVAMLRSALEAIAINTSKGARENEKVRRLLENLSLNGEALQVEVTNGADDPVLVDQVA